jgi:hypothetical protein
MGALSMTALTGGGRCQLNHWPVVGGVNDTADQIQYDTADQILLHYIYNIYTKNMEVNYG